MKLTLFQLFEFRNVINSLHTFKFSAKVTFNLAKNLCKINEQFVAVEKSREKLLADAGSPKEDSKEWNDFVKIWEKFLHSESVEVDLVTINYNALRVGESEKMNNISPSAISILMPILDVPDEVTE